MYYRDHTTEWLNNEDIFTEYKYFQMAYNFLNNGVIYDFMCLELLILYFIYHSLYETL